MAKFRSKEGVEVEMDTRKFTIVDMNDTIYYRITYPQHKSRQVRMEECLKPLEALSECLDLTIMFMDTYITEYEEIALKKESVIMVTKDIDFNEIKVLAEEMGKWSNNMEGHLVQNTPTFEDVCRCYDDLQYLLSILEGLEPLTDELENEDFQEKLVIYNKDLREVLREAGNIYFPGMFE